MASTARFELAATCLEGKGSSSELRGHYQLDGLNRGFGETCGFPHICLNSLRLLFERIARLYIC